MALPSSVGIGTVLDGKYRVEAELGEGGMGLVFRAKHVETGKIVAIKIMRDDGGPNAVMRTRFEREARALVALSNEHVARIFDVGYTAAGAPFIVMEHLVGRSLEALVVERGRLDPDFVLPRALEVCQALVEAHAMGIIHRDLKPANVFIVERDDGRRMAKVLDFGIAKIENAALDGGVSSLTKSGALVGTPWFMAPEQVDTKQPITPKTDVWAIGATMYNALTGKTPFDAETLYELSVKIYAHEPTPIRKHRPELGEDVVEVVEGCLRKDPKKRFTLGDLVEHLDPLVTRGSAATMIAATPRAAAPPTPVARRADDTITVPITKPVATPPPAVAAAPAAAMASTLVSPARSPMASPPPAGARSSAILLGGSVLALIGAILGGMALRSRSPATRVPVPSASVTIADAPLPEPSATTSPDPPPPATVSTPAPAISVTTPSSTRPRVFTPHPSPSGKQGGALTHER